MKKENETKNVIIVAATAPLKNHKPIGLTPLLSSKKFRIKEAVKKYKTPMNDEIKKEKTKDRRIASMRSNIKGVPSQY